MKNASRRMRCASQLLPGLPPDAEIFAESGSDLQDGKRQARELATCLVVLMFGRHERSVAVLGHRRSALFNRGPQSLLGASSAMIPTCPCSIPQSLAAPERARNPR